MRVNDFTTTSYEEYLKLFKKNYNFSKFSIPVESGSVLWRHDVDISVHRALKLALLEEKFSVHSTFFILLHSEYYNVFDSEIYTIFKRIQEMGHSLALHFDPNFYFPEGKCSKEELEEKIKFEVDILESLFNTKIEVFSFHNPDVGRWLDFTENFYSGLISTYGEYFKDKIPYCSDSNGYWRFQSLDEFVETNPESAHVLTHPVWWQEEKMKARNRVHRSIDGRGESIKHKYDQHFVVHQDRLNEK